MLENIQKELYLRAVRNKEALTTSVDSYEELKQVMATKRGFVKAFWCEDEGCEKSVKGETKASTRCLPFIDNEGGVAEEDGFCIKCGRKANHRWLFAQAY